LGFYISFSGIITFKSAGDLREVAKKVPLDRILVETDAPYLTPVPYRGKPNSCSSRIIVMVSALAFRVWIIIGLPD
jgi:TatD DNase family protein